MPGPRRIRDNSTGEEFTMDWYGDAPPTPDDIHLYKQQQEDLANRPWYSPSKAWDTLSGAASSAAQGIKSGYNAAEEYLKPLDDPYKVASDLMSFGQGVGDTMYGLGKMAITPPMQQATEMANQYAVNKGVQAAMDIPHPPEPPPSPPMFGRAPEPRRALAEPENPEWAAIKGMSPIPLDPLADIAKGVGYATYADKLPFMPDFTPPSPTRFARSVGEMTPIAMLGAQGAREWWNRPDDGGGGGGATPPTPPVAKTPRVKRTTAVEPDSLSALDEWGTSPQAAAPPNVAPPPDMAPPLDIHSPFLAEDVQLIRERGTMTPEQLGTPEAIQEYADQLRGTGGPELVPPVEPPVPPEAVPPPVPPEAAPPLDIQSPFLAEDIQLIRDAGTITPEELGTPEAIQNYAEQLRQGASIDQAPPPVVPDVAPPVPGPETGQIGAIGPDMPTVDPIDRFEPIHPEWMKVMQQEPDLVPRMMERAQELGIDPTTFNDLDALDAAIGAAEAAIPGTKTMADAAQTMPGPKGPTAPLEGAIDVGETPLAEAAPVAPVKAAPAPGKPRIRSETDTKGNTRVWLNDVELTDRFGPGGPTMAELRGLQARIDDPAAFKRLAELKGEQYVGLAEPVKAAEASAPTLPEAPAPALKPPAKPTPERVLRIARGKWDAVKVVFPDKLHADLFSGVGRLRKATRGETGIKPDFENLGKQLGVTTDEAARIASDYRAKVMEQAKALPKTAGEGTDVLEMEAPRWDAPGGGPSTAQEMSPKQTELRNKLTKTIDDHLSKIVDTASEMTPKKGKVSPDQALADLFNKRAAEVGDTKWNPDLAKPKVGELPKGKGARVQLIVDELSTKEMESLLKDREALNARAEKGGVSPEALKQTFMRFLKEETGAVQLPSKAQLKKGARKAFDVANQVRMTSMLSGLALPKSLAGNIGSHLTAALEGRTLEPIKVLGNVRAIARDLKLGWKHNVNPAMTGGVGKINIPGRLMGMGDYAAVESLVRAGLSRADAREIMLTNANAIANWPPFKGRAGQFFIPFKTIPFNQLGQALTRWKKYPAVYAGAVALGALSGAKVKDKEALALLSAFAGPYAVPFLAGAAISGGARNLEGISPIPEWGIVKTLTSPFSPFTQSPGRRWFRSNLGFGQKAAMEKKAEMGQPIARGPRSRGRRSMGGRSFH